MGKWRDALRCRYDAGHCIHGWSQKPKCAVGETPVNVDPDAESLRSNVGLLGSGATAGFQDDGLD